MTKGLSLIEVAEILGCSKDQVRAFISAGELSALNIGLGRQRARYTVQRDVLEAFVARRTSGVAVAPSRKRRLPTPRRDWV